MVDQTSGVNGGIGNAPIQKNSATNKTDKTKLDAMKLQAEITKAFVGNNKDALTKLLQQGKLSISENQEVTKKLNEIDEQKAEQGLAKRNSTRALSNDAPKFESMG